MKIYKIAKVTSEDCVAWLIQNEFPNTQPSEWKRRSKKNVGNYVVRVFENITSGQSAAVYEANGVIAPKPSMGSPEFSITQPQPQLTGIEAIKANLIKVDLTRPIFPKPTDPEYQGDYEDDFQSREGEWTGRIIFGLINPIEEGDDEISFYCGPEEIGGNLEDTLDGGVGAKLEMLLSDLNPSIMSAENAHDVPAIDGISLKELWRVIKRRLVRSGAVEA